MLVCHRQLVIFSAMIHANLTFSKKISLLQLFSIALCNGNLLIKIKQSSPLYIFAGHMQHLFSITVKYDIVFSP